LVKVNWVNPASCEAGRVFLLYGFLFYAKTGKKIYGGGCKTKMAESHISFSPIAVALG